MTWYSTANSPFGSDVGAPPGGGFAVNVFLRDLDTVYRTWHTSGRGTEQLSYTFALIDLLPYGRQEQWQDSPEDWPQSPPTAGGPAPKTSPRSTGQTRENAPWQGGHRPGQAARSGASWVHDGRPPNCQLRTSMPA